MTNQSVEDCAKNPLEYLIDRSNDGYNIILLAEHHASKKSHEFLAVALPRLRQELNLEFLAVELDHSLNDDVRKYIETADAVYKSKFESGLRRGTDYSKILTTAGRIGLNVVCIDYKLPRSIKDKVMCNSVPHGKGIIYVGGAHAAKQPGFLSLGFYLVNRFGNDKVLSVYQEDAEISDGNHKEKVGFLKRLDPKRLSFKPALFDSKDRELYERLMTLPEIKKDVFFATAWFANYDGIIYHPKIYPIFPSSPPAPSKTS